MFKDDNYQIADISILYEIETKISRLYHGYQKRLSTRTFYSMLCNRIGEFIDTLQLNLQPTLQPTLQPNLQPTIPYNIYLFAMDQPSGFGFLVIVALRQYLPEEFWEKEMLSRKSFIRAAVSLEKSPSINTVMREWEELE